MPPVSENAAVGSKARKDPFRHPVHLTLPSWLVPWGAVDVAFLLALTLMPLRSRCRSPVGCFGKQPSSPSYLPTYLALFPEDEAGRARVGGRLQTGTGCKAQQS